MEELIKKYIKGQMTPDEILQFRKDLNTNEELRKKYEEVVKLQKSTSKKNRQTSLGLRQIACSLAAAASLALFIMSGASYIVSNHLKATSDVLFSEIEPPVSRSANIIDEKLQLAYSNIGLNDFSAALELLEEAEKAVEDQMKIKSDNAETDEYNHSVLLIQQQEIEWYKAIILMKKGKVDKSKIALQDIVNRNGLYAKDAQTILDSKFNL